MVAYLVIGDMIALNVLLDILATRQAATLAFKIVCIAPLCFIVIYAILDITLLIMKNVNPVLPPVLPVMGQPPIAQLQPSFFSLKQLMRKV